MSSDRSSAVWVGVAIGIGVLFLALVQIRAWVFDLQARVEQIAEENTLYQSKLQEALASLQQSGQDAQVESSQSDKPTPTNGPALTEEPVHEKVPTPKTPTLSTKTSTEPQFSPSTIKSAACFQGVSSKGRETNSLPSKRILPQVTSG